LLAADAINKRLRRSGKRSLALRTALLTKTKFFEAFAQDMRNRKVLLLSSLPELAREVVPCGRQGGSQDLFEIVGRVERVTVADERESIPKLFEPSEMRYYVVVHAGFCFDNFARWRRPRGQSKGLDTRECHRRILLTRKL